ncbi:MAG: UDP-N-acetyl-D-glucosamine dehydrogenase, partial [Gemmatimonadetes bacterium]|nr:UDP-N-acetyl-D-glucosamine dehydrogenase [Gemmatimonadota bacterium]
MKKPRQLLLDRIEARTATLGVVGLGYVGLPLAIECARSGFRVIGFDVRGSVIDGIRAGRSHVQ